MMNCPVCQVPLSISDRQGVEIDYCPKCRGVWLDRGELDKLIEREQSFARPAPQTYDDRPRHDDRDYRRDDHDHDRRDDRRYDDHGDHHKKHKKEGLLGDLFDF